MAGLRDPASTQRTAHAVRVRAGFAVAGLVASALTAAPFRGYRELASPVGDWTASILVYHRFGPVATDAMTVRTTTFRRHLEYLKRRHHAIVPLRDLVGALARTAPAPPAGAVVLTADDGHRSLFTDLLPLVRAYHAPVTLFIYPSAISNASYAMTWDELRALRRTGLVDIQSHTYWHPNFETEKRRLTPRAYRAFATMQLVKPRTVLRARLGAPVDLIAWPFGRHDADTIAMAREAGYVGGVTLERRMVTPRDDVMTLPRFLVTERVSERGFASMLPRAPR